MKRKKSGNSLIVVVTTCMFVTTVSAATLSMVSGNYKARVIESKRVENLYSSDSGLDVAYNILGKTFDAATKYGYYEVEELKSDAGNSNSRYNDQYKILKNDIATQKQSIVSLKNTSPMTSDAQKSIAKCNEQIQEDNNAIDDVINDEFKRTFQNFINGNMDEFSASERSTYNLGEYISQGSYVNAITYNNKSQDKPFSFDTLTVSYPQNSSPQLSIPDNGLNYDSSSGKYTITIKSSFSTIGGNTAAIGENSRIVQSTYTMIVPNYKDIFYQQVSGELHEYLALTDRALTIGGDMHVNNANSLNVTGNVFVQGNEPSIHFDPFNQSNPSDDRTYEKYSGGITISDSSNVDFHNDVVTRNTFNIQDGGIATIEGDLYGRNVYLGNIASGDNGFASSSTLNANEKVALNNDLALKANNSTINIKDFYGINDKNINYDDSSQNPSEPNMVAGGPGDKAQSSSCIIVNGNGGSKINISDSAYIMGTAHIDTIGNNDGTNEGYQTGESGAVKGNYIAYSVPLNEAEKFDYYNPMQLLKDSNVFNKADHFKRYWDPDLNNGDVKMTDESADTGGINWPGYKTNSIDTDNIWSIGAIVYQVGTQAPKVITSHYSPTIEAPPQSSDQGTSQSQGGPVYMERLNFAKYVYKFGQDPTIADYDKPNPTSFDSLMNLTQTTINNNNYKLDDQISSDGEKAIFNYDQNTTLVLKSKDSKNVEYKNPDGTVINNPKIIQTSDDNINAVIATNGNVIIDGGITFKGAIIAEGYLSVTGAAQINYDKDVVDRIQTQNYQLFDDVFGNSMLGNLETTPASTSDATDSGSVTSQYITYDLKKFLQNSKWKIIK